MRRKSSNLQERFRSGARSHQDRLASFRQQMSDYARGAEMERLRKERHLSQASAAYNIGVTERTVRSWEKGGAIQWANAKRAAAFYKVDPESLVSRELANMEGVSAEQINRIEENQWLILQALTQTLGDEIAPELDAAIQQALQAAPPSFQALAEKNGTDP